GLVAELLDVCLVEDLRLSGRGLCALGRPSLDGRGLFGAAGGRVFFGHVRLLGESVWTCERPATGTGYGEAELDQPCWDRMYLRHADRASLPDLPAVTLGHSLAYLRFRAKRGELRSWSREERGSA